MSDEEKLSQSSENHRFSIAVLLISAMALLIAYPLVTGSFTNSKDMAGIFSGWIAAIVGFYFLQQNADKAQSSSKTAVTAAATAANTAATAAQAAASATDKAATAYKKVGDMSALHEATVSDFQNTVASFAKQFSERRDLKMESMPDKFKPALDDLVNQSNQKAQDARDKAKKLLAD